MADAFFQQTTDAVLDYTVDWSLWLAAGDTIAVSTWESDTGLSRTLPSKTDTQASVFVEGAQTGTFELRNKIETQGGRKSGWVRLSIKIV